LYVLVGYVLWGELGHIPHKFLAVGVGTYAAYMKDISPALPYTADSKMPAEMMFLRLFCVCFCQNTETSCNLILEFFSRYCWWI